MLTLVTPIIVGWNTIKDGVVNAVNTVKEKVSNAWNTMKSIVTGAIDGIKAQIDKFKQGLASIADKAQEVINRIRSIFSGQISFPHIRLPHFSVEGGVAPYGLGGMGSMPRINVQWYKKAYENPVMFTSPTVLGTSSGMKGFGDGSGAEIVMGLNKLRELMGTSGTVINVYPSQGMNETALAQMVQDKLVQLQKQRNLAYA